MTHEPPPHEATHWTARAMAKAVGLGVVTVQRIWNAHGLAPHRWRTFKLSSDPAFVEKLRDVVGLYVAPPAHAVVLSIDEKRQIQALDRTQPGLPLKRGPRRHHDPRLQTQRHDDAVRRAQRPDRRGHREEHAASPPSGVHPLPERARARHPGRARSSTSSSTTCPRTRRPRFGDGSPAIRAGPSTSPRLRARGSTRSRASSPSSPGDD